MDIIVTREDVTTDLNLLSEHVESLYNMLYDHRRGTIASCHDCMIETMSNTLRRLREKVMDASPARG